MTAAKARDKTSGMIADLLGGNPICSPCKSTFGCLAAKKQPPRGSPLLPRGGNLVAAVT
jgi:hypothetical protein